MTDTTEAQEGVAPEVEAKAREMGWKPQEEWSDDGKAQWLPADEFMERQQRLTQRADKAAQQEIRKLQGEIGSLKETVTGLTRVLTKTEQRMYQKALKELEQKADAAAADGDTASYQAAKREMKDIEKEAKEAAKEADTKPQKTADEDPDFVSWWEGNAWYNGTKPTELRMTKWANELAMGIPVNIQGRKRYEAIAEAVREEFPDYFENPRRKGAQAVESGNGTARPSRSKEKSYSDLPKEAKTVCDDLVKQGVIQKAYNLKAEDTEKARAAYVKDYFAQEGE